MTVIFFASPMSLPIFSASVLVVGNSNPCTPEANKTRKIFKILNIHSYVDKVDQITNKVTPSASSYFYSKYNHNNSRIRMCTQGSPRKAFVNCLKIVKFELDIKFKYHKKAGEDLRNVQRIFNYWKSINFFLF